MAGARSFRSCWALGVGIALALVLVVPGAASGAVVEVKAPCVINTVDGPGDVPIVGSGFAPDSQLSISTDGNVAAQARSDSSGAFSFTLRTPVGAVQTQQTVALGVADASGTNAQTTYQAVLRSLVIPRHTEASKPATLSAYGFPGPRPLRLFWGFRGRGRGEANLGLTTGPCGTLTKPVVLLERRDPDGVWRIGAGQSRSARRVAYVFRVRKRGTGITFLGPE